MNNDPDPGGWKHCEQCGQQLRSDAGFCDRCGAEQREPEHPRQTSTAQPSREDTSTSLVTRRRLIATGVGGVGTLAVGAFALGALDTSEGAAYEPGNKESLLPNDPGPDWPDTNLVRDDSYNDDFGRSYVGSDRLITILIGADIFETVSRAKSSFNSARASASSPDEYPLADEAIIVEADDVARCVWRGSNATGETAALRQSGRGGSAPDRTRATQYADFVYANYW